MHRRLSARRGAILAGMLTLAIASLGARCIENTSLYTDSEGYVHVAGEMVNETDVSASTVTLQASLYDSAGNLIAQQTGLLCPESVQPNTKNSFDIKFFPAGISNAASYEVRPISGTTIDTKLPPAEIHVTGFDARRFGEKVAVRGDVKNLSVRDYDHIAVCVAFYNDAGKVVHVFASALEDPMPSDTTYHFGITDTGYVPPEATQAALWFISSPERAWLFIEPRPFTAQP